MNFELTGKIFEIYPTQQKTEKFRSRDFVLDVTKSVGERMITDYVKFQLTNDRCDLLNKFKPMDIVTVNFNIRGNRWEKDGKVSYFTNLEAWRITGDNNDLKPKAHQEFEQDAAPYNDGLPF